MYDSILSAGLHLRFQQEFAKIPPPQSTAPSAPGPSHSNGDAAQTTIAESVPSSPATPNSRTVRTSEKHETTASLTVKVEESTVDSVVVTEEEMTRMTASNQCSHVKPHLWISLWFALTIPVIFWDVGYCFMRPRSMVGGDWHWLWSPYALYQNIDYVYGLPSFERGDGFTNAQSLLNVIENFMNIAYLWLAHYEKSPVAPVLGFASATMTLSKTFLYWAQEYYCGGCAVGHNTLKDLLLLWVLPNGLWLVVPSFVVYRFAKDISAYIRVADSVAKREAAGKKE